MSFLNDVICFYFILAIFFRFLDLLDFWPKCMFYIPCAFYKILFKYVMKTFVLDLKLF